MLCCAASRHAQLLMQVLLVLKYMKLLMLGHEHNLNDNLIATHA